MKHFELFLPRFLASWPSCHFQCTTIWALDLYVYINSIIVMSPHILSWILPFETKETPNPCGMHSCLFIVPLGLLNVLIVVLVIKWSVIHYPSVICESSQLWFYEHMMGKLIMTSYDMCHRSMQLCFFTIWVIPK